MLKPLIIHCACNKKIELISKIAVLSLGLKKEIHNVNRSRWQLLWSEIGQRQKRKHCFHLSFLGVWTGTEGTVSQHTDIPLWLRTKNTVFDFIQRFTLWWTITQLFFICQHWRRFIHSSLHLLICSFNKYLSNTWDIVAFNIVIQKYTDGGPARWFNQLKVCCQICLTDFDSPISHSGGEHRDYKLSSDLHIQLVECTCPDR